MPVAQQEVLDPGSYQLRHVAPLAVDGGAGIIAPFGAGVPVLGQTLYAKPLPVSQLPHSPDFSEGQYILRGGDAGEFTLTFPNRDASDGQAWRDRFDSDGHTEFIEISREGELEACGVITSPTIDRQKIVLKGYDAFWLTKKQYEQDFSAVMAPRDIIERYSALRVPVVADNFAGSTLNPAAWTLTTAGTVATSVNNGLTIASSTVSSGAKITSVATIPSGPGKRWSAVASFTAPVVDGLPVVQIGLIDTVTGVAVAAVFVPPTETQLAVFGGGHGAVRAGLNGPGVHTVQITCDGRTVRGYLDGILIGTGPGPVAGNPLRFYVLANTTNSGADAISVTFSLAVARGYQPFLMRGTDKGDYVLPGSYGTYPAGGLHGRYYNDLDLQGDPNRLYQVLGAERTSYADQLDATLSGQINAPGAAPTNWSCRWFGAVWLPLATHPGTYMFTVNLPTAPGTAVRLWVGKTTFGDQIVDGWSFTTTTSYGGAITSTTLAGTNADGTVTAKDGWYPLVLEYAMDTGSPSTAPTLQITTPVGYTDPGGSTIGPTLTTIPATSLSSEGCIDNRYQGISFFDIVQQTAQAAGYQFWCKPQSLESGLFPGSIAPRVREGRDWDEIIEQDDIDRRSGINNVVNTIDATDFAACMQVRGAGLPDGKSQLAAEVMDPPTQNASLFDAEAWVDAQDIAYPSLLAARGQAELAQRLTSWTNIAGDPFARDRPADTFPLTGRIQGQLRWRPFDGVRLQLPDVNVVDIAPRQMLQITRTISPAGRTSTSIGFRQRPKDGLHALRQQIAANLRSQRGFQTQHVERTGNAENAIGVAAGAVDTGASVVALTTAEHVIGASVRLVLVTGGTVNLLINGVDVTGPLNGPWGPSVPVWIDVSSFAVPASAGGALSVQVKNNSGAAQSYAYQLLVNLLVKS